MDSPLLNQLVKDFFIINIILGVIQAYMSQTGGMNSAVAILMKQYSEDKEGFYYMIIYEQLLLNKKLRYDWS